MERPQENISNKAIQYWVRGLLVLMLGIGVGAGCATAPSTQISAPSNDGALPMLAEINNALIVLGPKIYCKSRSLTSQRVTQA
jgi:hypothetical protein